MKTAAIILCCLLTAPIFTQTPVWKKTGYIPSPTSRINDATFLSSHLGWVVNGVGQIHRTTNAGTSWVRQFEKSSTHFRSVIFFDSLNGFAGALGWGDPNNTASTDTNILYKTTNGGNTWAADLQLSSTTIKRGFCGVQKINDSVAVAVGRVRGPGWFYKTTNRGVTWQATNLSALAAGLIDVYFFTPDSGIAVGLSHITHDSSSAIIISTRDGGSTWRLHHKTSRRGEWAWKIFFPSPNTGYISLQRNSLSPIYFLKTTNGGITWNEKLFFSTNYFVQGIGFADDNTGWIGGNSANPMYQTTDGGDSWKSIGLGRRINRFRMLNSQFGYAVGDSVYQWSIPTSVDKDNSESAASLTLYNTFPNPTRGTTTISFSLAEHAETIIRIYSINGELIRTLLNTTVSRGVHSYLWDGENEAGEPMPSGEYIVHLLYNDKQEAAKLILIR